MRSLQSLGGLLVAGLLAFSAGGCIVVHDHDDGSSPPPPPPPAEDTVNIDAGQGLTTDLGEGVAVLLEYEGGSSWNVQTTCDTLKTNQPCTFDIYVRGAGIAPTGGIELESTDFIDQSGDELHAGFDTDVDLDGFTFDTVAGADVEVEVYLDGDDAAPYVFWVGDGATHTGMGTNPTIFLPSG